VLTGEVTKMSTIELRRSQDSLCMRRAVYVLSIVLLAGLSAASAAQTPRVAVLLVDTDRVEGDIDLGIYGHFLEHINHSVVDGLFAEQVRGQGFEGNDFRDYWRPFSENGSAQAVAVPSANGDKCVRFEVDGGVAGIRQDRVYLQEGHEYDGSLWLKAERGAPAVLLRAKDSAGGVIAEVALETASADWREAPFAFACAKTDPNASIELAVEGSGAVLLDHVSLMRADVRRNGMLRPDLVKALADLKPPFLRWPGGSFASFYNWRHGIGPQIRRVWRPNELWGGYSDYNSFGTHEFLELCRQIGTEPLVCLRATSTDKQDLQDALDWVHYLNDPPTTALGKLRAANGHPEPYNVRYLQIDNEPMNHGLTPDQYADIVNLYGAALRQIAPQAKIVACGQKRSNAMIWSETVIDKAGRNFDILGCHNYEYEPDRYVEGVTRIEDYLVKLREYIRRSEYPQIKIGVLEWSLCRTYDWRAGLHTAGSLILYERLSPALQMSCPALLMRNTTDDPKWTAFIYHDHVSWFPGSGYIVEKLFREHYGEKRLASAKGTFDDIGRRNQFFDEISTMIPTQWRPGTVDAIASRSADGKRIVIKAVNYNADNPTLLVRLQGSTAPERAEVTLHTIAAEPTAKCSIESPDAIRPQERTIPYAKQLQVPLPPYSVSVIVVDGQ
jgi:alpha-N-arabinofuranosidase